MAGRGPNDFELLVRVAQGLAPAGDPERLADLFGHRHAVPPGQPLDLPELGLVQKHLQASTRKYEYVWLIIMSQSPIAPDPPPGISIVAMSGPGERRTPRCLCCTGRKAHPNLQAPRPAPNPQ